MKIKRYSHKTSDVIVENNISNTIENILRGIKVSLRPRCATKLRNTILSQLRQDGWSGEVRINSRHNITLTGMKERTALCIQTGNMARFYADLLKIQAQYQGGKIDAAIYIIPTLAASRLMGENMANFERLTSELCDLFSGVITAPILIYGIEDDQEGD